MRKGPWKLIPAMGKAGIKSPSAGAELYDLANEISTLLDGESTRVRMANAARRYKRVLMTAHVLRFSPEYSALREAVLDGQLGLLRFAVFQRWCAAPSRGEWWRNADKSGGGAFLPEQDRPARSQLDRRRDDKKHGRQHHQHCFLFWGSRCIHALVNRVKPPALEFRRNQQRVVHGVLDHQHAQRTRHRFIIRHRLHFGGLNSR